MMWLFLISIGIIWLIFASVQDLKTKEVANWVSFSLIILGLGARLIYGINSNNINLFYNGIVAGLICTVFALLFYYSRVFAGGDAKLLMGLGTFVPGTSFSSVISNSLLTVFSLLLIGAIYSIIFSLFIVMKNKKRFIEKMKTNKKMYFYIIPIILVLFILFYTANIREYGILAFLSIALLLYPYLKSVDSNMIKLYNPKELKEGDWLTNDIIVKGKTISASVNGLSKKDILLLIKNKRKVEIKEGIPFVPAFLITFLIMALFFVLKGENFFLELVLSLF